MVQPSRKVITLRSIGRAWCSECADALSRFHRLSSALQRQLCLHRPTAVRSYVSFLLYLAEPSRGYSEGRRLPGDSCILGHVALSSSLAISGGSEGRSALRSRSGRRAKL